MRAALLSLPVLLSLIVLLSLCQTASADDPALRSWSFGDDVVSIEKIAGGDGFGEAVPMYPSWYRSPRPRCAIW